MQEAELFSAVMKDPSIGVDHCLSSHMSKLAAQNRLKLTSIAETCVGDRALHSGDTAMMVLLLMIS